MTGAGRAGWSLVAAVAAAAVLAASAVRRGRAARAVRAAAGARLRAHVGGRLQRRGRPPLEPGKWIYDTGTGYGCAGCPHQWGTFEIETMSKSTRTSRSTAGDLADHAREHADGCGRRAGSRRADQLHRRSTTASCGCRPRSSCRRPASGPRRPATGRRSGCWDRLPRQLPQLARHRRDRHHGERQRPADGLLHAALRRPLGRPVQRDQRHRRTDRRRDPAGRLPHYAMELDRASSRTSSASTSTTQLRNDLRRRGAGRRVGKPRPTTASSSSSTSPMGGAFPWAECNFFPHAAGAPAPRRSRRWSRRRPSLASR